MNAPVDNRRKVRSSAILLGCFAVAVYLGFIVWSVTRHG
jgi:hypothetical protein